MKKTNQKKLEEFIRVDRASERGTIKIYEDQLLTLKTLCKDSNLQKTIEEMKFMKRNVVIFLKRKLKKEILNQLNFYLCGI